MVAPLLKQALRTFPRTAQRLAQTSKYSLPATSSRTRRSTEWNTARRPPTFTLSQTRSYSTPPALTVEKYHQIADNYLDSLVELLEEKQETRTDYDVEYSAGVLEVKIEGKGTYVINKQPPNRQIWLSSPITGPKRYDWVEEAGQWVCGRDNSTLSQLVSEEMDVEIDEENLAY